MSTRGIGGSLVNQGSQPEKPELSLEPELSVRYLLSVIPPMSSEDPKRSKSAEEESLVALRALAGQKPPMGEKRRQVEEWIAAQRNPNPAPTANSPRPGLAMASQGAQAARAGALPPMAFGAADWQKYFGDVGAEPPLPPNIDAILNGPCAIWPGKTIKETHLLVLVPGTVNKKPFTLDYLEQLIQHPQAGGHATQYKGYWENFKAHHGSTPAPASHWVLMTRDVVAGTRDKSYADQQKIVARYSGYEAPRILEAATAILMEHVKTGNRLYPDDPWTYTRCQDQVEYKGDKYPSVIGGFASGGLVVHNPYVCFGGVDDYGDNYGLAVLRKL